MKKIYQQCYEKGEIMKGLEIYLILSLIAIGFAVASYFVKKEIIKIFIFIPSVIVAICCIGVFTGKAACEIERFNYNAWYSENTEYLIHTVIKKLEDGEQKRVIQELKALDSKFDWTYQEKGHYNEYVLETVNNLHTD